MKTILLAGAILLTALVAGCGGSTASVAPGASAAATSAGTSSAASPAGSATAASTTPVTVKDFKIEPIDVKVAAGNVTFAVTNQGPTVHNVTIRDASGTVIVATKDLTPGSSETISAQLQPGSYVLFCSLAGHESLGTKAALDVAAP